MGEPPDDRHAVGGGDQIEAEPPEVAGVARAVAVAGVPGQIGALDGFPRGRARQRGGIDQAQQLVPGIDVTGQLNDHRRDQRAGAAQPLAVAGLLGQLREHLDQVPTGVAHPASLAGHPQQLLGDRHTQQLGVGEPRFAARSMLASPPQGGQDTIIEVDIQCGQEGVTVIGHTTTLGALRPCSGDRDTQDLIGLTHLGE